MLLWFCVLWVFAATVVAMLPVRFQNAPGGALMMLAPVLILWAGMDVGWWAAMLALMAFISMFRSPLRHFSTRIRDHMTEIPE